MIALRNVIINSATSPDFSEDVQLLFVRYIDELTPSHLRLLHFLVSDAKDIGMLKSYTRFYELYSVKFPDAIPRDEFRMLVEDLSARGLVRISSDLEDFEDIYHADKFLRHSTNENLPKVIITDVAKQFLNFITSEKRTLPTDKQQCQPQRGASQG